MRTTTMRTVGVRTTTMSWREDEALDHGDRDLDDVIYNKYIHEDYDHDDFDQDSYDQDDYDHDDYGEHDLDGWYGDEY